MIWYTIVLMAMIVFMTRYLFLEPALPLRLNHTARRFLQYACPTVLTAIWGPLVLAPEQAFHLGYDNPYLVGAIVAGLMIWKTGKMLLTILTSMGVFLAYKLLFLNMFLANG